jgi:hypothetical protein
MLLLRILFWLISWLFNSALTIALVLVLILIVLAGFGFLIEYPLILLAIVAGGLLWMLLQSPKDSEQQNTD